VPEATAVDVRRAGPAARTLPYWLAAALFAGYTAVSVSQHLRLGTSGFDLGVFEQAVRGYADLRAPTADLKGPGFNLLGDHFHPMLALLAPAYRLFPSPVTLLVAQALLLALSAVPVTRLAARVLGPARGALLGLAYGLSWGLQEAVRFDFHEVSLAVPLLAFSLEALATGRWVAAVAWAVPMVLVKEDLPATVAAIGGCLLLRGQRRLGLGTILAALAAGLVVVLVAIPAANPQHAYLYSDTIANQTGQNPLTRLVTPATKTWTLLALLVPTGFLAVRSELLLVAIPTLLWRFWSTNHNYWGTSFHYSATLMPIVFIAATDTLRRLTAACPTRTPTLRRLLPAVAASGALIITLAAPGVLPLGRLARPATLGPDAHAVAVRAILRTIPDGASVAANNRLAAQLTARCRVYLFPYIPTPAITPEWVAVTNPPDTGIGVGERAITGQADLPHLGYQTVVDRDGVILFRLTSDRGSYAERGSNQPAPRSW